jgi:hypothetical protein
VSGAFFETSIGQGWEMTLHGRIGAILLLFGFGSCWTVVVSLLCKKLSWLWMVIPPSPLRPPAEQLNACMLHTHNYRLYFGIRKGPAGLFNMNDNDDHDHDDDDDDENDDDDDEVLVMMLFF